MYWKRYRHYINDYRESDISIYKRSCFICLGALLVAVSLQLFLIKNYVIDGGIIGIGIILSHITGLQVGLLLLVLNIPFFILGYTFLGKRFVILSFYAIFVLTFATNLLEPFPPITDNPILVIIFGGITLGLGVGTTILYGGSLDGTEVMAILFSRRSRITIGQCVLICNFFIFGSAIFIYGLKAAIFSLATFLVAYKTIDLIVREK
ncbi:YitT family protein [Neobacillus mesonae]|uniref:YitT family protein n=1 Tax=Neobacillus mesonae TaxID=1193713 RepID=UPI00203E0A11|nr:YitT family protein [Neobacillus mesonae]MCM3569773.1 YitT family protein [Neobacillus mesonae]